MAEVGTYYITIMPDMSKFTGGVNKALGNAGVTGGKEYSKSFSDVLKGSALGTALGNLAVSAGRSIMGGLQTGIGRLDTIKNFPKVMDALGFSANDAQKSIQLIMERLDGLPTATQDVVTLTQAIADSTGDLNLATEAALGFNDMMLANGASAAEVVQAQGVLNRVLGKGNATVAQWASLQSVMPAQLAAVAREIGGESMSVEELRDQLNDGTISWDEFLQAIVKLDHDGSGAMKSFNDQARANSVGIGTALENVTNRIGAGWASILDAFGQENISGTIDKISYGIRDAMQRIAEGIGYVRDLVADTAIADNLKRLGESIGNAFSALWNDGGPDMLKSFTDALVGFIDGALQWLADNGDLVGSVLVGIAAAFAEIAAVNIVQSLMGLPAILTAIGAALSANPVAVVVGIAAAVAGLATALYNFFKNTETGQRIVKTVVDGVKNLVSGLVKDFRNMMGRIKANLEDNRVQWEKFKANVKNAVDNVKNAVANAIRGVLGVFKSLKEDVQKTVQTIKRNLEDNKKQWEVFTNNVKTVINGLKTSVATIFAFIKNSITQNVNAIKSVVTTVFSAIRNTISVTLNSAKNTATTIWNGIRNSISSAINGAKNAVSNAVSGIKSLIANCRPQFPKIQAPDLSAAKNAVSNAVQKIKDTIANVKLALPQISLPHIKLPHFSITGGVPPYGLGGKGSLPHFSVSWYAKGGVFDNPTIIGVGEGASAEAVLPLNDGVYRRIARGIVAEGGGGGVIITGNTFYVREEADIDRIADRLARKIRREGVSLA